jgi:hypothetical protein
LTGGHLRLDTSYWAIEHALASKLNSAREMQRVRIDGGYQSYILSLAGIRLSKSIFCQRQILKMTGIRHSLHMATLTQQQLVWGKGRSTCYLLGTTQQGKDSNVKEEF